MVHEGNHRFALESPRNQQPTPTADIDRFRGLDQGMDISRPPPELDLGVLKPGERVRRTIDIRDSGRGESLILAGSFPPAPENIKLILSPPGDSSSVKDGPRPVDPVVATLEVDIVAPSTPWDLKDRLAVFEANQGPSAADGSNPGQGTTKVQVTPGRHPSSDCPRCRGIRCGMYICFNGWIASPGRVEGLAA